jgi:glycosyltransferase involved in cell wall biosynthesis
MRFSIVIPAHNGEKYLAVAIGSALSQTRKADEIIVLDDDSRDSTAVIAQSAQWGGKIKYYYNELSTGFVDSWNRAIGKASGDFVVILHQDDLLHSEYIEHIERATLRYPSARHFYAACNYIDGNGKVIWTPPKPYSASPILYSGKEYAHNYLAGVVTNNHIHRCPGVATARSLLLNECSYRKEAGQIADDDFFLRVGAFTDVVGISQPRASFRHHQESETGRLGSLTLRLARDYMFQAEYYKDISPLLNQEDIGQIYRQAVRFINLLLFQSLLDRKTDWKHEAYQFREKLDILLPGFIEKSLPMWGQVMWKMTSPQGSDLIAQKYVRLLALAIKSRNFMRSIRS